MSTQQDQDRAAFEAWLRGNESVAYRIHSNPKLACFAVWQAALKYERERQAKWQTECQAREPMPRPDDVARVLGEEEAI